MKLKYIEIVAKPDALYTPRRISRPVDGISMEFINCPVCGVYVPIQPQKATCHSCQVYIIVPGNVGE